MMEFGNVIRHCRWIVRDGARVDEPSIAPAEIERLDEVPAMFEAPALVWRAACELRNLSLMWNGVLQVYTSEEAAINARRRVSHDADYVIPKTPPFRIPIEDAIRECSVLGGKCVKLLNEQGREIERYPV